MLVYLEWKPKHHNSSLICLSLHLFIQLCDFFFILLVWIFIIWIIRHFFFRGIRYVQSYSSIFLNFIEYQYHVKINFIQNHITVYYKWSWPYFISSNIFFFSFFFFISSAYLPQLPFIFNSIFFRKVAFGKSMQFYCGFYPHGFLFFHGKKIHALKKIHEKSHSQKNRSRNWFPWILRFHGRFWLNRTPQPKPSMET